MHCVASTCTAFGPRFVALDSVSANLAIGFSTMTYLDLTGFASNAALLTRRVSMKTPEEAHYQYIQCASFYGSAVAPYQPSTALSSQHVLADPTRRWSSHKKGETSIVSVLRVPRNTMPVESSFLI